MKNQQINKFLLMFFLSFTLFFSVSNAVTIEPNTTLPFDSSNNCLTTTTLPSHSFCGLSYDYIAKAVWNAYVNNSEVALNEVVSTCASQGFSRYIITLESRMTTQTRYEIWFFPDNEEIDFGCYIRNGTITIAPYFPQNSSCYHFYYFPELDSANYGYRTFKSDVVWSSSNMTYLSEDKILKINGIDIKLLDLNNGLWDGESYYYKAETDEPEEPAIPTISDSELANIHEILMKGNLSERFSANKRYFIVYDFVADFYDAYFYPDIDLVYRYFDVDENYEYTNYSNSETGYIELSEKNSWHSFRKDYTWYENIAYILNPDNYWEYQLFRKYDFNSNFLYKWTVKAADAWNEPGGLTLDLSSKKIVYTSHDIGHMIVDNSGDETIGSILDEDSIKKTELKNPETGDSYVLSDVPENSVEDVGFWENLINFIVDKIFNVADALLTIFGVNVVTLIFAIAIKAITVLVSSIALVFRFASFILTLVAIPATSALLAVDVATNSSGLIFAGMNWGTRFVEGLEFIKALQWNGLGLWTLFEIFVASLEVVLFVKIVRKHYRSL